MGMSLNPKIIEERMDETANHQPAGLSQPIMQDQSCFRGYLSKHEGPMHRSTSRGIVSG